MIRVEDHPLGIQHVCLLTMDVPTRRNALSLTMASDLARELSKAAQSSNVKVIVLTGEGDKAFSSGLDLNELNRMTHERAEEIADAFAQMFFAIHRLQKPLLTAVNGSAVGAGFGLMLASDLAVLSTSAQLGTPEIRHGIVPVLILRAMFNVLPFKVANSLLLTGGKISADEALRLHVVNQIAEPKDVLKKTLDLAAEIAKFDSGALWCIKNARRVLQDSDAENAIRFMKEQLKESFLTRVDT